MQISFEPLVQCLDVDNLIKLFTAVLLERRVLIRSNKQVTDSWTSNKYSCHIILHGKVDVYDNEKGGGQNDKKYMEYLHNIYNNHNYNTLNINSWYDSSSHLNS